MFSCAPNCKNATQFERHVHGAYFRGKYFIQMFSRSETNQFYLDAFIFQLLEKYGASIKVGENTTDDRECMLCGDIGDGVTEGTARYCNDYRVYFNSTRVSI